MQAHAISRHQWHSPVRGRHTGACKAPLPRRMQPRPMSLPPRSESRRSPASRRRAQRPTCPPPSASRSPHAIEAHQRRRGRVTQTHGRPAGPRLAAWSRRGCTRERRLPGRIYPVKSAPIVIRGPIRAHQSSSVVIRRHQTSSVVIRRHPGADPRSSPWPSQWSSQSQSATHLGHVASKVELGQRATRKPTDEAGTQASLSQLDDTCIGPKRRRKRARISSLGGRRGIVEAARDGARECDPARACVIQRPTGALSNPEPERATAINGHQWQSTRSLSEPRQSTVISGNQLGA